MTYAPEQVMSEVGCVEGEFVLAYHTKTLGRFISIALIFMYLGGFAIAAMSMVVSKGVTEIVLGVFIAGFAGISSALAGVRLAATRVRLSLTFSSEGIASARGWLATREAIRQACIHLPFGGQTYAGRGYAFSFSARPARVEIVTTDDCFYIEVPSVEVGASILAALGCAVVYGDPARPTLQHPSNRTWPSIMLIGTALVTTLGYVAYLVIEHAHPAIAH